MSGRRDSAMPNDPISPPVRRFWQSGLFRVLGSVAILTIIAAVVPVGEIVRRMRDVPAETWFTVLALFMAVQLVAALKFHIVLHSAGVGLPFSLSVRCYFAALFGNVFLPSIIGGDVVSIGLAMRYSPNRPGVALGALVNRLLDFLALACMTVLGTILLHSTLSAQSRRVFWAVAGSLSLLALGGAAVVWILLGRRYSFRVRRRLTKLRRAARAMQRRKGVVALGLAMGVFVQSALVTLVAWLGRASGLDISVNVWFFAWPLAKLAAVAPVTIGGIGAREAAFAAMLAPFGIAATRTVAVGLLYEAISVSGGLLAGMISWAIAARPTVAREESGVRNEEPNGTIAS